MALNPVMKQTIRWMAETIRDFAESRNWAREDYRLFFAVNENWSVLDFVLAVKGLDEDALRNTWYALWARLGDEMKRHLPSPFATHGLVIRSFEQLEEGGLYRLDPSFEEIEFPENNGRLTSSSTLTSIT